MMTRRERTRGRFQVILCTMIRLIEVTGRRSGHSSDSAVVTAVPWLTFGDSPSLCEPYTTRPCECALVQFCWDSIIGYEPACKALCFQSSRFTVAPTNVPTLLTALPTGRRWTANPTAMPTPAPTQSSSNVPTPCRRSTSLLMRVWASGPSITTGSSQRAQQQRAAIERSVRDALGARPNEDIKVSTDAEFVARCEQCTVAELRTCATGLTTHGALPHGVVGTYVTELAAAVGTDDDVEAMLAAKLDENVLGMSLQQLQQLAIDAARNANACNHRSCLVQIDVAMPAMYLIDVALVDRAARLEADMLQQAWRPLPQMFVHDTARFEVCGGLIEYTARPSSMPTALPTVPRGAIRLLSPAGRPRIDCVWCSMWCAGLAAALLRW